MKLGSQRITSITGALTIALLLGAFLSADAAIKIKTGSPKTALETYVINDAVQLMAKMFTDAIDTSGSGTAFDIVIGTPQNNPLISQAVSAGSIALPTGKNAGRGYAIKTVGTTIYLAAASDTGLSPGIYDLLQQYDAYFQISSEILPAQTAFAIKTINISVAPAFKYCGLFPWDNFLDGMSGWNEEDFKLFIDRMVRLRMNFIEFHCYPGMSYYNETYSDGSRTTGDHVADWQNSFQTSSVIGKEAFGSLATFGTRQWYQNQSKGAAVQTDSCQAMMRRVIDYAHSRGVSTVIGFCLMQPRGGNFAMTNSRGWSSMPDPLNAHNADLEVDRYRRLVQIYPNSDYYWMWQAEAGGALWNNVTNDAAATAMRNQYASWVPNNGKKGDIDYAYLFLQTVNKLTAAERSRIATGGWDMSELFNGFNSACPSEIIFHDMNSWDTRGGINEATNEYTFAKNSARRGWLTDWWEYDGLAFFTQYRVMKQEKIYKGCFNNNVECVTLDGWKQSGVEHNVKYLAEFNWNPTLTGSQFYSAFCQKLYGSTSPALYNYYYVNDSLEPTIPAASTGDYRDMNICEGWQPLQLSALSSSANIVSQCQTLQTKQNALIARDQGYLATLTGLRPQLPASGQYWLDLMINRLNFRIQYVQGLVTLNKAYVTFSTAGKTAAIADLNTSLGQIKKSVWTLAGCARNTSDLGLIGQINILVINTIKNFITSNGGTVETEPGRVAFSPARRAIHEVSIYGLNGRCIAKFTQPAQWEKMELHHSGIYFVKIKDAAGAVRIVKKCLVEKQPLATQLRY
jgi:hypothetical protein